MRATYDLENDTAQLSHDQNAKSEARSTAVDGPIGAQNEATQSAFAREQFRNRRLWLAVGTSLLSKVMTAVLQIIAVPIAIRALGVQGYALYAALIAVGAWITLLTIQLGPPLTIGIASAKEEGAASRYLSSALAPVLVNTLLLGIAAVLFLAFYPVEALFHTDFGDQAATIRRSLSIYVCLTLLGGCLNVVEAAQAGYQENYLLNLRSLVGNTGALIATIAVALWWPSIEGLVVAFFAPTLLTRLVNAAILFRRRPFLWPRLPSVDLTLSRSLVVDGVAFSLASTLSAYLCHHLPVVLIGKLDSTAAATFSAGMALIVSAFGVISMMCVPLWPAISDSLTENNHLWVKSASRKVIGVAMVYATCFGALLMFFGKQIFHTWLASSLQPSQLFFSFGAIYSILLTWEYVHFMILVGMGKRRIAPALYLLRALISIGGIMLIKSDADYPVFAVLCTATLLTAVSYPVILRNRLRELRISSCDT